MKRFLEKNQTLTIKIIKNKMKNSYKDITLSEYIQIVDVLNSDLDELDKYVGLISILKNETLESIIDKPASVILELSKDLSFLNELPSDKVKLTNELTLNNQLYFVNLKINDMTTEDFIDYIKIDKSNVLENLDKVLSLFLKPVIKIEKNILGKKKYIFDETISKLEIAEEIQNHLNIEIAYSYMVFFYQLSKILQMNTNIYLAKNLKKIMKSKKISQQLKDQLKNYIEINGVG